MNSSIKFIQVHTTIPEKYHKFARDNKLAWNELLIKAIELEMQKNPEILIEKLENNKKEKIVLEQQLQQAKQINTRKKTKLKDVHRGLIPTD